MMKVAVIFESSPFDRKGLFNAVHNRIKHLVASGQCHVEVFCVHSRDNAFTRKVRHTPLTPDVGHVDIDGIRYQLWWYKFSVLDHIALEKLHRRPPFFSRFISRKAELLKGYDAVIAHSFTGALIADEAYRRYGVRFYANWHGSDIHTHPWRVPVILEDTALAMKDARCNFFVSQALMKESDRVCQTACKRVLHNGVSEQFRIFSKEELSDARGRYGLSGKEKVVAFAGSLVNVKNVRILASLFSAIRSRYEGELRFWIVGDGKLRGQVEADLAASGLIGEVTMFGNVPSEEMPAIMNVIDVLLLPSFNEGLPLVCAEAIRCGANVVGSDVGGIPEVIGEQNVFSLDGSFVNAVAERTLQMLTTEVIQDVPASMSWEATVSEELSILMS